jgi:hypothetical protein
MKIRTIAFLSIIAVLLAATVIVVPARGAPAAQTPGDPGYVRHDRAAAETAAASLAYWTPERMAAAQPMPLGEAKGSPGTVDPASAEPMGAPVYFPGSAPGEPARGAISEEEAFAEMGRAQPQTAVTSWYAYPFPYTFSFMGAAWPQFYPMRTNGKLYFSQNGGNYVCSGTSVTSSTSGNNELIATAGHCVHDGSGLFAGWSYNFLFCPAYMNGVGPWGCWGWDLAYTTNGWYYSSEFRSDHGFVVAHPSGLGTLAGVIGTNGLAANPTLPQDVWSFGYPADAPFNGQYLVWVTSGIANTDDCVGLGTPNCIGIGSLMTGGSSGGAWSIGQALAVPGYVIGHNDYKYTVPAQPLAMYSPSQSTDWLNLYNCARVSC